MGQTHAWVWECHLIQSSKAELRDAATIIVLRQGKGGPSVLMGQRGASAAFMPNKFVFPGGAVDQVDAEITLATPLSDRCMARLAFETPPSRVTAMAATAIRELWEETGQIIGAKGDWPAPGAPQGWRGYAATGARPSGADLSFVFRAITPPGRPRRFDARFFLTTADALLTDPDDFSRAEDELSHLQWVPLNAARKYDLPFVTEIVLAELTRWIGDRGCTGPVPFYDNRSNASVFRQIA